MKKTLLLLTGLLFFATAGICQQKKTAKKVQTAVKKQKNKSNQHRISLNTSSSNEARSTVATTFFIADPIITTLNSRANGSDVAISSSGIVGMPKRAYGFANGRILLRNTLSTTSGTSTGTPSVGSGNSMSTIGSSGASIGLNGKSADAGSAMWGNARGLTLSYKTKN